MTAVARSCPACGADVLLAPPRLTYCGGCGTPVGHPTDTRANPPRPPGVTVLAIAFTFAAVRIAVKSLLAALPGMPRLVDGIPVGLGEFYAAFLPVMAFGYVATVAAVGLWRHQPWARTVAVWLVASWAMYEGLLSAWSLGEPVHAIRGAPATGFALVTAYLFVTPGARRYYASLRNLRARAPLRRRQERKAPFRPALAPRSRRG